MLYCPGCHNKIQLLVSVENLPGEYSSNILTDAVRLVLSSIGYSELKVSGLFCIYCKKQYTDYSKLLMKSSITSKLDTADNFLIISVKSETEEFVDKKIALIIPPKIIHKNELELYKKEYVPYKENKDKMIIVNPIKFVW